MYNYIRESTLGVQYKIGGIGLVANYIFLLVFIFIYVGKIMQIIESK